jgi:D-glycero-alpha-D-manno-heptose-7-phosphate kinase
MVSSGESVSLDQAQEHFKVPSCNGKEYATMIISRTPFRISFFGGGTDYPAWYRMHGGEVLSATINKYCYLSCRYLPPFFDHRFRVVWSMSENCQEIEEIQHPVVRAVLQYMEVDCGLEIHHDSDLPARSGIGSSSAFTVGLVHAMYSLRGRMVSKEQLARESIYIEQEVLKEVVGSQDQVSAAYGGLNHISFPRSGEISVRPVTLAAERVCELNAHLMLFYTGIKRTASDMAKSYVDGIDQKKRQLRILKDMVQESLSILASGQNINGFGELLHEGWMAKRGLSSKVSNPEVDALYEEAVSAGAIGGKLTGAGGGGFLLLFVPPPLQTRVRERLSLLINVPFKFDFAGSQIIYFDPQEDYSDLEKVRTNQVVPFRELALIENVPGNGDHFVS